MSVRRLPKITIVTPSFNQGEFLGECIESLLSQTYPNLEFIIVDGGSSDESVAVIQRYDKHLAWWCSEPDEGQYHAVQKGFGRSTGDIMGWLNSDDKHHDFSLFKLAYLFNAHRNVEWLTGRHSFWRADGSFEGASRQLLTWNAQQIVMRMINGASCIQQESTFWRRSLWERSGAHLAKDLHLAGDFELWCRMAASARLYTVDTPLAGFRRHPKQKTAQGKPAYMDEARNVAGYMGSGLSKAATGKLAPPSPLTLPPGEFKRFLRRCGVTRPVPAQVMLSSKDVS